MADDTSGLNLVVKLTPALRDAIGKASNEQDKSMQELARLSIATYLKIPYVEEKGKRGPKPRYESEEQRKEAAKARRDAASVIYKQLREAHSGQIRAAEIAAMEDWLTKQQAKKGGANK